MGTAGGPEDVVGRQAQLLAIDDFLAGADRGTGALILEGEPGIGKTVLWRAGVERARRRGYRVLVSCPSTPEFELSLAGLADLLGDVAPAVIDHLPPPQRKALAVALLLEEAAGAPADQRALGAAFLASLRLLHSNGPVLIALDDVQWLDSPSAWVLEFALRRLDAEPIRVLAARRKGEPEGWAAADVVGALHRDRVEHVEVGPLTVACTHELIRARLGLAMSRPALLRLHEVSGGNPLYAIELAEASHRDATAMLPAEALAVPRRLQDLIGARLARVSPGARATLLHLAALGRASLATLTAVEGPTVAERLDEAERAGLVECVGDQVQFAHPLLASVHYAAATAAERRAAHARLAGVVSDAEEQARHRAIAATAPAADVASALDTAAVAARARGAPAAAAELFERAISLTPAEDRASLESRRARAAEAYFAAGAVARAVALYESCLNETGPGRRRAELLHRLAEVTRTVDSARSLDLLRQAEGEAGDDNVLRARILCSLSHWVYVHQVGLDAAEQAATQAVDLAERGVDDEVLSLALSQLAKIQFLRGSDIPSGLMQRAVALERRAGVPRVEEDGGASIEFAGMLLQSGRLAEARVLLEQLCETARAAGDSAVGHPLHVLAYLHFIEGRWDEARVAAESALEVSTQSGRETDEVGARSALGLVLGLGGSVEEARRHLDLGLSAALRSGRGARAPRMALGMIELSLGDPEAAWRSLELAVALLVLLGVEVPRLEVALAIEALVELERVDEANALLGPFAERAAALGYEWARAVAARLRGQILACESLSEAEAVLHDAVQLAKATAFPLEEGHALLTLGSVQRRLGRKQLARATLTEAVSVFQSLGAVTWMDRARQELARIGGRAAHDGELSPTEGEIVELVVEGRSNKEIAAALHISVKTVEWNLSKVYRKLGVASRTALAARARVGF